MKVRGMLTDSVKKQAEEYLGRCFTQTELRLYPYICDRAINNGRIERSKTTEEEQDILQTLENEGRLYREYPSYMHPTKDFYMFMQKILMETDSTTAEEMQETEN